jgi:hypothetical protein
MRKVRRLAHRWVHALRDRWNADHLVAAAMGWTVERGRFGTRVYHDPRLDQPRTRPCESVASGRWE